MPQDKLPEALRPLRYVITGLEDDAEQRDPLLLVLAELFLSIMEDEEE